MIIQYKSFKEALKVDNFSLFLVEDAEETNYSKGSCSSF